MTKLSVNLNAVAQLRNRRNLPWPSVTGIARLVLDAGASGVTVHPRPDERHIRRTDVFDLKELLVAEYPQAEFNIEGYPSEDFLKLVETVDPEQVTLVPDDPAQATSDHGWDFTGKGNFLTSIVQRIRTPHRRISLFADPDAGEAGVAAAKATGADRIELYTGPYGGCFDSPERAEQELATLAETAHAAIAAGLGLNAGHDLTLVNLPAFQAKVPGVLEASIGHGITADALLIGFPEAVRRYREALGDI
ncbi:pyridoxine 5'-phosphate synthase [Paradevosia shaoguanensis]|uniref:Pyridoxine 5'-phosphate synthase n=1 Tax=Paradevosia shaoguanensis TaxID=1335043 RepID=A0AA41UBW2_9HYPH|nr:pyridoxine 5'-phosphate synthase [Paradevosia shaoguanensis]KFL27505.1 pyridoxine 5'-phosphate synthase [Devosia sp. 17-2-E-8]MCF1743267.1 pyridoxine 5'-phosphate synthase [Paradevosia shaoguanensis]MCI0127750.1 pyridoxine 5'-phosphate synthase [Paradevosia shaoguanensis]CDP51867.1 Pyridoxine 5'-phosphate synthase [Devosia sp. DBB001]